MQRLLLIASMAGLMFTATGCLHHNVRQGHCQSCQHGACKAEPGLLNKLTGGLCHHERPVRFGCEPGPLGWQQGGTNYPAHVNAPAALTNVAPGPGPHLGALHGRPPVSRGPQGGTVGYPYYTTRGPRDFLLDNPPSIGR